MTQIASTLRQTLGLLATTLMVASAGAAAAPSTAATDAATYQSERAACLKVDAAQGRATCLKEAGAAHAEAQRGRLGNGEDAGALTRNAELRCEKVNAADQDACTRMARGEGTVSGSVAGGGLLRTLVTRTGGPAVPLAAPMAPLPASAPAR